MITILCVILAFIISGIAAFIIEAMSDGKIEAFPIAVLTVIIFFLGTGVGYEKNTNITTSNTITYTYECQICEETTTQTEEPKIMICDDCKETINNIKNNEKCEEK